MEPVISVCKHVLNEGRPATHLLGHRGFTLAAFCPECEVNFRKADEDFDVTTITEENPGNVLAGIAEPTHVSIPQAIELGIPEQVGTAEEECSVYGHA
jgi:hypothetical protein